MPLYLMIGPSITMPIPILVMVLFNVAVNFYIKPDKFIWEWLFQSFYLLQWELCGQCCEKIYEESMEIEEGQVREQSYRNYIEKNEQLIFTKRDYK